MQQYTIHPLVVGINETDQGVMTYLRDYGKRIYLPIYVFYLSGGEKNILLDTGLERFTGFSIDRDRKIFSKHSL